MKKKVRVKATIVADVWINEDVQGNQEIDDYEDIRDTLEFEVIEK